MGRLFEQRGQVIDRAGRAGPQPRRKTKGKRPDRCRVRWSRTLGPWCVQVYRPFVALRSTFANTFRKYRLAEVRLLEVRSAEVCPAESSAPERSALLRFASSRFAPP